VVGMVGLIAKKEWITRPWFQNEGDVILLLGPNLEELGGSEYINVVHGLKVGEPPQLDLSQAKRIHDFCLKVIQEGLVRSAHDCSEGGLAVAVAESCFHPDEIRGAELKLSEPCWRKDAVLFGETQSRIVISASPQKAEKIVQMAAEAKVPLHVIGKVTKNNLKIKVGGKIVIQEKVTELKKIWENSLEQELKKEVVME